MLGNFILPFFVLSWVLGLFGLIVFGYRISRKLFVKYLSTTYSIKAHTAVLSLSDINLTPNILVFFGICLFLGGLFFTLLALVNVKEKGYKRLGIFTLMFYLLFYLMAYPIILIISLSKFLRRKKTW